MNNSAPTSPDALPIEGPAWKRIDGVWRKIHGGFPEKGLSIEWHDFSNVEDIDWAESFHPLSLEICLNFSGEARLWCDKVTKDVSAEAIAAYVTGNSTIGAERTSGHLHRFFTVELSVDFLRSQLGAVISGLKPAVRDFLENPDRARAIIDVGAMPAHLLNYRLYLLDPPVHASAHEVWYQSKTIEICSHLFFEPQASTELFCKRHHRLNRERCERVRFLLERDIENPPSLDMLAKEVQCSSFYLSRIFVQQTGSSIPRYLRTKRVERAADLLRSGKISVTEVAMQVGYSSISSFNKAFVEHFGCCPGLYPHAKTLLKSRPERKRESA
ncbi:MAG TPA: AraC family transcriptional regulator [Candidatus Methylacidiphilales bacterium]